MIGPNLNALDLDPADIYWVWIWVKYNKAENDQRKSFLLEDKVQNGSGDATIVM